MVAELRMDDAALRAFAWFVLLVGKTSAEKVGPYIKARPAQLE
jgi:hypothetical protein